VEELIYNDLKDENKNK